MEIPLIDFGDLTPEILVKIEPPDPLYERAFLLPAREKEKESEYSRNTTTWD